MQLTAVTNDLRNWAIGGAVVGAVAAPIIEAKADHAHSFTKFAAVAAGGTAIGALAGAFLCQEGGAELLRLLRR